MPAPDWNQRLANQLAGLDAGHLRRNRRVVTPLDAVRVRVGEQTLINFACNDYLGFSHHPRVMEAATKAIERYGFGSGAAPLISGYTDAHASAEVAIAKWKGTDAAVLFSSGYQANVSLVQMLSAVGRAGGAPTRFLLDKLCHASLIDAIRAVASDGNAAFRVFPHNGVTKLERLMRNGTAAGGSDVVVTESIFSMDGDAADLAGITQLIDPRDVRRPLLVLDEAHGSGVYGPGGAGWAAEAGLASRVDVTVATLSKALGCVGAAVCGSKVVCDALVNFGRGYVFSTSMPAAVAAAAEAAIGVLRDEPWRQARVRAIARHVRSELRGMGMSLPIATLQPEDSPIVPILLGGESSTLAAAEMLRERGLLVPAIRPPTVPPGGSRLRVTLSCEHSDLQVERLLGAVRDLPRSARAKQE